MPKRGNEAFSQMYLAKALEGEVQEGGWSRRLSVDPVMRAITS